MPLSCYQLGEFYDELEVDEELRLSVPSLRACGAGMICV